MSIVHVGNRTTKSDREFEATRLSDRSLILVSEHTRVESYAIELTIGDAWGRKYGPSDNAMFAIPDEGIDIPSGGSIVVEVAENLAIPHNIYGLIVPTGSLFLDRAIIIAAAKIEPSFAGKLKLRLVNVSGERRRLRGGEKIASAVFSTTELTEFQSEVRKAAVVATRQPSWPSRAGAWSRANWPQIVTWLMASVPGALFAFWLSRPEEAPPPPAAQHLNETKGTAVGNGIGF